MNHLLTLGALSFFYRYGMYVLLVVGFGFVIFWHELGHFLAAKWVGIRVEQFAVGFGQALVSWRKGVGFRAGNTQKAYKEKIDSHLAQSKKGQLGGENAEFTEADRNAAADELGLGDTEYRLNWIPLGGYVKMLGQDDLRPDALADDPRAYNRKSVSARMLVISAGVIMNVILAAILFVIVFSAGLNVPPAWIGHLQPQSPAERAGLQVGDHVLYFDGKPQEDFTKIKLNTALAKPDGAVPITVERLENGQKKELTFDITPTRPTGGGGFVALGFEPPSKLAGPGKDELDDATFDKSVKDSPEEVALVRPGDVITAVNGQPVGLDDYTIFDRAVQQFGTPVELTVRDAAGKVRTGSFQPHFESDFNGSMDIAGMKPRASVYEVLESSSAYKKLQNGDVITSITVKTPAGPQTLNNPTRQTLVDRLGEAGNKGETFSLTILRDGTSIVLPDLKATADIGEQRGQKGLGVRVLPVDEKHTTIGEVIENSPAAAAKLQSGDSITAINGQKVDTWYAIHRVLATAAANADIAITYLRDGKEAQSTLRLSDSALRQVKDVRYFSPLEGLAQYEIDRHAPTAWIAMKWGVSETRDFILQFYLTLRRMLFERSVPVANLMGPVGIFNMGASISLKGGSWLLWFLAMISANLAVVNFLPIPVVDGGQFVFLMLEKIKGKPLSPKAMAIAQYVGLAFLAAVVVFVTYHDIMRRY